jgi:hypothetical protein
MGLLSAGVLLSACTGGGSADSGPVRSSASAPAASADQACPKQLARGDVSDHGFGTNDPAGAAPNLRGYQPMWACEYSPFDRPDGTADNGGAIVDWVLTHAPGRISKHDAGELTRLVAKLRPAPDERACTSDLGRRHVLVLEDGDGRVGVVMDGYGCRDIRLTDDLAGTVPGDGGAGGVVPGVLTAPGDLARRVAEIAS